MKKILNCLILSTMLLSAAGAANASAESEQDSICQALVTLANRDFADQWDDANAALDEDGYARRIYDNSTRFFASFKPEHYLLLKAAQRKQLSAAKLVEALRDVVYPMNAQLSREAAERAKKSTDIKIVKNGKARPIAPYLVDLAAEGDTLWYSTCGPVFDGPELTCYKVDLLKTENIQAELHRQMMAEANAPALSHADYLRNELPPECKNTNLHVIDWKKVHEARENKVAPETQPASTPAQNAEKPEAIWKHHVF